MDKTYTDKASHWWSMDKFRKRSGHIKPSRRDNVLKLPCHIFLNYEDYSIWYAVRNGSILLMWVSLLVHIFVLLALYCPQRSTQYSWDLNLYHVSRNLIGLSILGGKQIVLSSQRIILCLFVVSCFRTKLDKPDDFISIYLRIIQNHIF